MSTTSAQSPQMQRLAIAAAEEFRQSVSTAFQSLFGDFLRQFGGSIAKAAETALNPTDRQNYEALHRKFLSEIKQWTDFFIQNLDAHLIGGMEGERVPSPEQSLRADDNIALANLELRAEANYHKQITELDARVNRLRLVLYVPVYTRAVAPAGLFRTMHDTADALTWPVNLRRMLFEKFNSLFVPQLDGVYRSLIDALTKIGTAAVKAAAESSTGAVKTKPPKRPKKPATTMDAPPEPRQVDPETVAMLETFALKADSAGYTDGLLAADLLALADNRPLPGVAKDQSWVPLQRISLAGHFLNEVISDPMVPDELKPHHESMRYPLVKSALTDESLFTSVTHPLGSMVNELLLKSATSRITGNVETRRMAELLQQVLVQFDLAPEFVRQSMHIGAPIEETQIQRFFELQRQQAQQRRDFVISEAKRIVARELENTTFGRGTPPTAIKFLNQAWGPLLTKRLLQHGANHPIWKAGVALMEQLLDLLDARLGEDAPTAEWQDLMATMDKALVAEGMPVERVKLALMNLDIAWKTPSTGML